MSIAKEIPPGKRNLEQRRAAHAWKAIADLKTNGSYGKDADDYAREAKKLPLRIRAAGLGQALAFLLAKAGAEDSKKKASNRQLYEDLESWVLDGRGLVAGEVRPGDRSDLMQNILQGSSQYLRWATDESLAYLMWLNRFAEGEGLPRQEGGDS